MGLQTFTQNVAHREGPTMHPIPGTALTGLGESEGKKKKSPFPLPDVLCILLARHCTLHCAGRGLDLTLGQASLPAIQLGRGSENPRTWKGRRGGSAPGSRHCLRRARSRAWDGKARAACRRTCRRPGGRNRLRGARGRRRRKLSVSKRGRLRAEMC